MGSGFGHVYPKENRRLFDKIRESGMIMTEYPLTSRPLGFHFPLRNRIISGLSTALVVVEAAEKSGSLITARFALEQNREVLAVPGNITSELSRGTNWLIKNGAKPVETWKDVAEELPLEIKDKMLACESRETPVKMELNLWEKKLYECLSTEKMIHIDDIVDLCGRSVSEALTGLLNLELKGLIFQRPGKLFQRKM
jgi:DNA processing protein